MEITIKYKGVELDIEYDYQPEERPDRGPEAQYAGCAESWEIYDIKHKGDSFLEVFEDCENDIIDLIRKAVL